MRAQRGVDRCLIDAVDPHQLVAGALAADDRDARSADSEPLGQQPAQRIVRATVERRRRDSHHQSPVAETDDLVIARSCLYANGDLRARHAGYVNRINRYALNAKNTASRVHETGQLSVCWNAVSQWPKNNTYTRMPKSRTP